jgi:hypothetical protein
MEPSPHPEPRHHPPVIGGSGGRTTDDGGPDQGSGHRSLGTDNPSIQDGRTAGEHTDHHQDQTMNNDIARAHDRTPVPGRP